MNLSIATLVGSLCITAEDGETVREQIVRGLEQGNVVVDFAGVDVFASPFLNAAIGSLLHDYSSDDLNRRLRLQNLSPENAGLLRRVIENAREYFGNPTIKQIVDRVAGTSSRA